MSVRDQLVSEIDNLSEPDETLAALYAEFAEEDRELAEEGMADYAEALKHYELGEARN